MGLGPARATNYQLRQLLKYLVDGGPRDDLVVVERGGSGRLYRGEWIRTTGDRTGLLLLTPATRQTP